MLFSEYSKLIRRRMAGVAPPMYETALIDSLIEFCNNSRVAMARITVELPAGTGHLEVVPEGGKVLGIIHCQSDKRGVLNAGLVQSAMGSNAPKVFFENRQIIFQSPLPATETITAIISVSPTYDNPWIYDELAEGENLAAVSELVLSKLALDTTVSQVDGSTYGAHLRNYKMGLSAARLKASNWQGQHMSRVPYYDLDGGFMPTTIAVPEVLEKDDIGRIQ